MLFNLTVIFIKYIPFFRSLNPSRVYKLGDKHVEHNTSYLPDWKVFVQAFILFLIPYTISRFFIGFLCQRKSGKNELVEVKRQTSEEK